MGIAVFSPAKGHLSSNGEKDTRMPSFRDSQQAEEHQTQVALVLVNMDRDLGYSSKSSEI
jgi:hypothetical protein